MNKFTVAIAATGLLAGASVTPALAADLSTPTYQAPADAYAPAMPVDYWSGFYAGGYLGGALPNNDDDDNKFMGGIDAGYARQFGNFVVGGEISYTLYDSFNYTLGSGAALSQDWSLNTMAKAGFAVDKTLFYGTLGAAFTDFQAEGTTTSVSDDNNVGLAFGAGIEHQFGNGVGLNLQYTQTQYYDVGYTTSSGSAESDLTSHAVTVGVNYHF